MERSVRDLIYLVLCCFGSTILSIFSTWYVWNNQVQSAKLHDMFFELLPDISNIETPIVNYVVGLQYVVTFIVMNKEYRWKLLAQWIFLQVVILSVRSVTVSVTLLPNIHVYPYCETKLFDFFDVLSKMITHGTCSDYMFSGHTSTSFLTYLFALKYTNRWCSVANALLNITVMLLLILQRWHYTVDIIIAICVVWLLFQFYTWHESFYKKATSEKEKKKYDYWFYFNSFELSKFNALCSRNNKRSKRSISTTETPGYYKLNF